MRNQHTEWREIKASLNKLTEEQLGRLIHDAVESGMMAKWPGFTYEDRAGIRKFLHSFLPRV